MANRQELRNRVYTRTGFDTADGMVTPTVVNDALNEALHFIETVAEWWWLMASETLTTVASTATVTPSSSSQRTKSLAFADGTGALARVSTAEIDQYPAESAKPRVFAEQGLGLVLWPTPDAVYSLTHRFITTEADLAQDDAEPLLPAGFHSALIDYASYLLLRRVRDDERATRAFEGYQAWELRMVDNKRRGAGTRVPRIRDGLPV